MKNIIKKKFDPIGRARRDKRFVEFSRDANMRVNFGLEVYSRRRELGLSQQALAKKIKSTQKVISHIENAEVDIQSSTINKLNGVLNFGAESWSRIYGFSLAGFKIFVSHASASDTSNTRGSVA